MKKYYIYLTIVHHPVLGDLYYAGKGSKEEEYFGSCKYRWWKIWLHDHPEWFQTRRLRYFTDSQAQSRAETDLILKCLNKHGAYLRGCTTSTGVKMSWLDQFDKGACLNAHWNDASQLSDPTIREKIHQTLSATGGYKKFTQAGTAASQNSISKAKQVETRRLRGNLPTHMNQCHTPEIEAKRSITVRAHARKYILSDGFIGCCSEIAEHLNRDFGAIAHYCSLARKTGQCVIGGKKGNPIFIVKPLITDYEQQTYEVADKEGSDW